MLTSLVESRFWLASGWTMIHFLWVGSLIALLAMIGRRLLWAARPNTRYICGLATLAVLALSPAIIFSNVLEERPVRRTVLPAVHVSPTAPIVAFTQKQNTPAHPPITHDPVVTKPIGEQITPTTPSEVAGRHDPMTLHRVAAQAPWFWLAGTPILLIAIATGMIGAQGLKRHARLLEEGPIHDMTQRLGGYFKITEQIAVGICDRITAPILVGIIRPIILLPTVALTGWTPQQLEMVLLHELAHLRRWDNCINMIQRMVESLLFFHPAVWLISHWIRLEREHCCDEMVLAHTSQPRAYVETLLSLAAAECSVPRAASAMGRHGLIPRVRRILRMEQPTIRSSRRFLAALCVGFVLIAIGVGACSQRIKAHLFRASLRVPIVLDNNDPGVMFEGVWDTETNADDKYGNDYRVALQDGSSPANLSATFTPDLPVSGHYDVYARWPETRDSGQIAKFNVHHQDGLTVVHQDQRSSGGKWNLLGTFAFDAQNSSVVITSDSTDNRDAILIADALKWKLVDYPQKPRSKINDSDKSPSKEEDNNLILDNEDAGVSYRGEWALRDFSKDKYGSDYRFAPRGAGDKTATFTPDLAVEGLYEVHAWWSQGPNRISDAEFTINHRNGTDIVHRNEKLNGGRWNLIGTAYFESGNSGRVTITNKSSEKSGVVTVDAMKWELVKKLHNADQSEVASTALDSADAATEFIIDNEDPGVTYGGEWALRDSAKNKYGPNYRFAPRGKGESTATYTPNLPTAGRYEVYAWWPHGWNRASFAEFKITHRDGTDLIHRNEKLNGGRWNLLGSAYFNAGLDGNVTLTNYSGAFEWRVVMADAIKWRLVDADDDTSPAIFEEETASDFADRPPAKRHLDLRVVDVATGEPLESTHVEIHFGCTWNDAAEIKADAQGRCLIPLEDEEPECLYLIADQPGYVPVKVQWKLAKGYPIPTDYLLKLERGTTVGGIVNDEQGNPIEEVAVRLWTPSDEESYGQPQPFISNLIAATDADGRWQCDLVPTNLDDVRIRLRHPDYINDDSYESTPNPPVEELRAMTGKMVMKDGLTILGRVVDADGTPIASATVHQGVYRTERSYSTASTDDDGRFRLTGIRPETAVLTVEATGYAPELKTLDPTEQTDPIEFRLAKGHTIKGRVVDTSGNPLDDVTVYTESWRGYHTVEWRANTDSQGRFEWNEAPRDEVAFTIAKSGYVNVTDHVLTPADDEQEITMLSAMRIRGKVTDAETGAQIQQFTAVPGGYWRLDQSPHWQRHMAEQFENGEYLLTFTFPQEGYLVRVEAEGYIPSTSQSFTNDEHECVADFQLQRGQGPSGIVRAPDGAPLPGAEIVMVTSGNSLLLQNGRTTYGNGYITTKTVTDGSFSLPAESERWELVILHDLGFARVDKDHLADSPNITLTAWGKVAGTLNIGSKPGGKENIVLWRNQPNIQNLRDVQFQYHTRTGDDGTFHFDRVIPGSVTVGRSIRMGNRFSTSSHGTTIDVHAGETTKATIGGTGRPVVGRLVAPTGTKRTIPWQNGWHHLQLKDPRKTWRQELNDTVSELQRVLTSTLDPNAAKTTHRRRTTYYALSTKRDGTFRIDDVPAGLYELSIKVHEPTSPDKCGWGPEIGSISQEIVVPQMADGRTDEPLDVGTLVINFTKQVKVGDRAPEFVAQTLDGKPLKLSDYRGKYVFLDFWATWCGPCLAQMPFIKELHDTFGDDDRFVIIGLSADQQLNTVKEFLSTNDLPWQHAHIGDMSKSKVTADYAIRGIPATFLIGPDGTILAKDLHGETLKDTVKKNLGG